MTNIYIVTSGEYSDYQIEGAFSTEEKAEAYASTFGRPGSMVEGYVLDEKRPEDRGEVHVCQLKMTDGSVERRWSYWANLHPGLQESWTRSWTAHGASFKSAKHAHKLAVEARQKYLRETPPGERDDPAKIRTTGPYR